MHCEYFPEECCSVVSISQHSVQENLSIVEDSEVKLIPEKRDSVKDNRLDSLFQHYLNVG